MSATQVVHSLCLLNPKLHFNRKCVSVNVNEFHKFMMIPCTCLDVLLSPLLLNSKQKSHFTNTQVTIQLILVILRFLLTWNYTIQTVCTIFVCCTRFPIWREHCCLLFFSKCRNIKTVIDQTVQDFHVRDYVVHVEKVLIVSLQWKRQNHD